MCGIFGVIGRADQSLGERVTRCLYHRGPDDSGVWSSAQGTPVTLANTRLAIIDLSPAGHMPMANADGSLVIAYNGEVYNFAETRVELERRGYQFRSSSDTEVVLNSYAEWGCECVHRLRGMFAFLIWDARRQRLFAARDRLGIKPLYWIETPQGLVLASELKAIVDSGLMQPQLNLDALHHYLTFYAVPPPLTMLEGVHALLPGHCLTWERGRATTAQYWDLPAAQPMTMDAGELRAELRRLLEESIRLRMIADVPVGAFLSGGVDSSAVVALMTHVSGERLKTFSIGFEAEGRSIDERSYAQIVADRYDTDHTEVIVTGRDVAERLPHIIRAMDQPTGDGLNTYLVSQTTAQHVKVALSGLGGDELFAGYPQFRYLLRAEQVQALWRRLPRWNRAVVRMGVRPAARLLRREAVEELPDWLDAPFLARYLRTRTLFDEAAKHRLYSDEISRRQSALDASLAILHPYDLDAEGDTVAKVTRLELKGYMAHMLLRDTDAMSMAHSLEVRVPLIDHKLVEFAAQIPATLKLRDTPFGALRGRAKLLLTEALVDLLPAEVVQRRKQGFEMPVGAWLHADLRPVVEDVLSRRSVTQRGLFDPDAVDALYSDFQAGRASYMRIWALVTLELWQREFIDSYDKQSWLPRL